MVRVMATTIAPAERPDPITSNLRGFLLVFFVLHCFALLWYLALCFRDARIAPSALDPSRYESAYDRFALLSDGAFFVATAIGLFLILVRDPRTRGWWMTLTSMLLVLDVAQVWLTRALPHQRLHPVFDILVRNGFVGSAIWLAYWTFSSRVKIAFGSHYAQPSVSSAVLGALAVVAVVIVLLTIGAASLI